MALSPTDFPLETRSNAWPRAGLAGADPAMEGYLVRHNEMAGGDALGGFVPYLDVVASDADATADVDNTDAVEAAAKPSSDAKDDPR